MHASRPGAARLPRRARAAALRSVPARERERAFLARQVLRGEWRTASDTVVVDARGPCNCDGPAVLTASASEPVVTYRAPATPIPHPPRRGAGRGPVSALARWRGPTRRVVETRERTDRHARPRRRRPSPRRFPDGRARRFFKDFRPGSRPPSGARDAPRSSTTRRLSYLTILCRSPRKRGGGPRVLGRAARLTEGPLKTRSRDPPLSRSLARARGGRSESGREIHTRKDNFRERGEKNDYPERWITWLVGR